jgi:hypothetical protein
MLPNKDKSYCKWERLLVIAGNLLFYVTYSTMLSFFGERVLGLQIVDGIRFD